MKQLLNSAYLSDLIDILKQADDAFSDASYIEADPIRYYDYRTASMDCMRLRSSIERVLYHVKQIEAKEVNS